MGESRRKKERRPSVKPTDKLPPIPLASDRAVCIRQRDFCRTLITKLLDDESSLSFSKPVLELWDKAVLGDYFDKIKRPMDLGTVQTRLGTSYNQHGSDHLFDPNAFREELRLVFLNALEYNAKGTDLARYASRFVTFIDAELAKLPMPDAPHPPRKDDAAKPADSAKSKNTPSATGSADDDADADDDDDDDDDDDLADDDDVDKKRPKDGSRAEKTESSAKKSASKAPDQGKAAPESDDDADVDMKGGDEPERRDGGDKAAASGGDDDGGDDDGAEVARDSERERLLSRMAALNKQRDAQLAELELEQSSPLSYDEISALRDEVEALPWATSQKVVEILRQHVDEALQQCDDTDPEFVTLEFSAVETKLLRKIESFVKPNEKLQAERDSLAKAESELDSVRKKLKRLADGTSSAKRKRAKKGR